MTPRPTREDLEVLADCLDPPRCWFASTFPDAGPCDGRIVKAHLIKEQTIRREAKDADPKDPRVWVPSCGGIMGNAGHQALYKPDGFRPVPRGLLPSSVEEFAVEFGLVWYLERTFPRVCGFCGDRDQRWDGSESPGWVVREGRDVCPQCVWVEPWNQPEEKDAA